MVILTAIGKETKKFVRTALQMVASQFRCAIQECGKILKKPFKGLS